MLKGSNKYEALAKTLQGFYTLETLAKRLHIDRTKAIYVIYRLRKIGCVKTSYGKNKKRIYHISPKHKTKGTSYTEKINSVASSKSMILSTPDNAHYVHDRELTYEEVLIYAIQKREVRYLITSLVLFRKITDWSELYKRAKKENLVVEVAALYDLARKVVRKVRRMPTRFLNLAQKTRPKRYKYLIRPLSTDDFQDIEKKWKLYIPLNRADLKGYE